MIQLKDCQELAVNKLINKYCQRRNTQNSTIYFQAPTGSGKTLILCDLCDKLLKAFDKCIILFISISTGDIHFQNYNKANKYKAENDYKYDTYLIQSPSNLKKDDIDLNNYIQVRNKCVYFMGSSTYTKKSKIRREQSFDILLEDAKKQGYEIIYIRDEAHIGTDNNVENLDNLLTKHNRADGSTYTNGTIYVSATLEQQYPIDVEITYQEAIDEGLIKGNPILFEGLDDEEDITGTKLLEHTLKIFTKEVQKEYAKLPKLINPCLLIQISNTKKTKDEKEKEEEIINSYIKLIEKYNLKWIVYTDNSVKSNINYFNHRNHLSSFDKDLITANDSDIDVVIFKVALATGWDIPRANMLLQLRQICSNTLDIQTIGRIRRNPLARKLNLDKESPEKILNNYYIYSNVEKVNKNECQALKENDELKVIWRFEHLKEEFQTVLIDKTKSLNNNNISSKQRLIEFYNGLIADKFNKKIYNEKANISSLNQTWEQDIININQKISTTNRYHLQLSLLYLDEEHKNNVPLVSEDITNVFQVEKYWNEKNKSYNDKDFVDTINEFVQYYANKMKLNPNAIKLFFCDDKYKEAFAYFRTEFKSLNKDSEFEYMLSDPFKLPKKTLEYLNDNKRSHKSRKLTEELMKYLYWVPDEENNESKPSSKVNNYVYNDSHGEKEFVDKMLSVFEEKFKYENPHVYFLKNYINNSNFRYEYIDEQPLKIIRSHYPDFIIEKNNEIYVCELKSLTNDYDSAKTKELEKAYVNYSKRSQYHYIMIKWDAITESFTWKHWFGGLLLNSHSNEKDLSKIFI